MRVALFPGQGLDARVVLKALDPNDERVKKACDILGYDVVKRVEQVSRRSRSTLPTALGQPAILTAGIVAFDHAVAAGERFEFATGHSLGEYTALVAAGSISFEQGVGLVAARGNAMQRAATRSRGGMAAVIGLSLDAVERIAHDRGLTVANDNAPSQVVVSGDSERLADAADDVRAAGGRCVLLPVEGSFHSAAMAAARSELEQALTRTNIRNPRIPVIANVGARPYRAPGEIRKLLALQLTERVRFRESILHLVELGATEFVDLGPGDVVGKLARACIARKEAAVV